MQINELLAEVCHRKRKKKPEQTLHRLNELFMLLPDGEQQDVSQHHSQFKNDLKILHYFTPLVHKSFTPMTLKIFLQCFQTCIP